jgi:hypothetical protein
MNSHPQPTDWILIVGLLFVGVLTGCDFNTSEADRSKALSDSKALSGSTRPIASGQQDPLYLLPSTEVLHNRWRPLLDHGDRLRISLKQLAEEPSTTHLATSRKLWLATYAQYQQLWSWRRLLTYHLPANTPAINQSLDQLANRIDPWPIAPGYLDIVPDYPASGLMSDFSIPLTKATLSQQHQLFSQEDAALGFHALASLLWPAVGASSDQTLAQLQAAMSNPSTESAVASTLVDTPQTTVQAQASLDKDKRLTKVDTAQEDRTLIAINTTTYQRRRQYLQLSGEILYEDLLAQKQFMIAALQAETPLSFYAWSRVIADLRDHWIRLRIAQSHLNSEFEYPPCGLAPCNGRVSINILEGFKHLTVVLNLTEKPWPQLARLESTFIQGNQQRSHQQLAQECKLLANLHQLLAIPTAARL